MKIYYDEIKAILNLFKIMLTVEVECVAAGNFSVFLFLLDKIIKSLQERIGVIIGLIEKENKEGREYLKLQGKG